MQEVYNQLFCLFTFVITGIAIGILFDIFRILRKSFKTADWITYLQDILFWILAGSLMLFSIFTFNNGEIRSYVFIGIILGIIIYMLAISKYLVKLFVTIIQFFKKILSYPIHLLGNITKKIIIKPLSFLGKKGKATFQNLNKKRGNFTYTFLGYKKIQNLTKYNYKKDKKHKKIKEKEGILEKM